MNDTPKTKLFGNPLLSIETRHVLRADSALQAIINQFIPDKVTKMSNNEIVINGDVAIVIEEFTRHLNSLFIKFEKLDETVDEFGFTDCLKTIEKDLNNKTMLSPENICSLKIEVFCYYVQKLNKELQKQILFRVFRDFRDDVLIKKLLMRYFH
tara:strand:+ start:2051 stop:2512 length:462 start_codon:yes stop_codon:yes gene_type:complete